MRNKHNVMDTYEISSHSMMTLYKMISRDMILNLG